MIFTSRLASLSISTFIRSTDAALHTLNEVQRERYLSRDALVPAMDEQKPVVNS